MLSVRERQTKLKELGYYTGKIDGDEGGLTKLAYLKLQKQWFTRKKDQDGIYGNNTDILLQNVYNFRNSEYFKLTEFKCKCGGKYCTGYPTVVDTDLIRNLNTTRKKYGRAAKVTSGLRCPTHNKNEGGVSNSRHRTGKAADIQIGGVDTLAERKELIKYWVTLSSARYAYCNGWSSSGKAVSYPSMGRSVHVDVQ